MDRDEMAPFACAIEFINEVPSATEEEREGHDCFCGQDWSSTHSAVRLHCSHIFGRECLFEWCTSSTEGNTNKCPMCRTYLFTHGRALADMNGLSDPHSVRDWNDSDGDSWDPGYNYDGIRDWGNDDDGTWDSTYDDDDDDSSVTDDVDDFWNRDADADGYWELWNHESPESASDADIALPRHAIHEIVPSRTIGSPESPEEVEREGWIDIAGWADFVYRETERHHQDIIECLRHALPYIRSLEIPDPEKRELRRALKRHMFSFLRGSTAILLEYEKRRVVTSIGRNEPISDGCFNVRHLPSQIREYGHGLLYLMPNRWESQDPQARFRHNGETDGKYQNRMEYIDVRLVMGEYYLQNFIHVKLLMKPYVRSAQPDSEHLEDEEHPEDEITHARRNHAAATALLAEYETSRQEEPYRDQRMEMLRLMRDDSLVVLDSSPTTGV
ncbi:unnamed protein product [Periconia digitata]|uniref:RING-type domain-containing protein n=1 Tax=Periconia digitata TaxID=1303443 RepID=A0A9W4UHY2_9PLEO|nr:unnamed protein product [Periconia digitata]